VTFPVQIPIGPYRIDPHVVFEFLAYTIGFRVYLKTRSKEMLPFDKAIWVVVGAIAGAAIGSKILFWFENPPLTLEHITDFMFLMGGKTIVGGLLGGLIGVEFAKKRLRWTGRTGDDFVIPLIVGMSIGRIGCFLSGLQDDTSGSATTWFTGVNFGDDIPRHPTQLYEIAFLIVLGIVITFVSNRSRLAQGARFQIFMLAYLAFRLGVDFLKPRAIIFLGLGTIQIVCILGILYYIKFIPYWRSTALSADEPTIDEHVTSETASVSLS
jgi:phosphatidylglycerol:prolipoprotein diacylglycerol transferase